MLTERVPLVNSLCTRRSGEAKVQRNGQLLQTPCGRTMESYQLRPVFRITRYSLCDSGSLGGLGQIVLIFIELKPY